MLGNTQTLLRSPGVNTGTSVSLIDTDNGNAEYKYSISAAETIVLKVQNQETKENPPVGTKRVQIRLEHQKVLESGLLRTAFVSLVLASPRDTTFSTDQMVGLVQAMTLFITDSETVVAESFEPSGSAGVFIRRLLSGEV